VIDSDRLVNQLHFLAQVGQALSAADDPVSSTEQTLKALAASFGIPEAEVAVLPTMLMVRARDGHVVSLELASGSSKSLRLDQIGTLYAIVERARRGELSASDGLAELVEMWSAPARFGALARVGGHVVLTIGLGLILTPQPAELMWCAGLGLLVGLMFALADRWPALEVLLPVAAALVASVVVFAGAAAGLIDSPLLVLIAPLITFLPGSMLTTAMVELADHHPIAGASRLVAGATQVVLLVFGIIIGQSLVGLHPGVAFAKPPETAFVPLVTWLGPFVFALGMYVHYVGPRRSLPWLVLVVYVAWVGEQVGVSVLGGYLGGFFGALMMTLVAHSVPGIGSAPPAQVMFVPGFWLLVPGVLAVVGLAEFVGSDTMLMVALVDLSTAAFTIVSIALGVLVGVPLARALRALR